MSRAGTCSQSRGTSSGNMLRHKVLIMPRCIYGAALEDLSRQLSACQGREGEDRRWLHRHVVLRYSTEYQALLVLFMTDTLDPQLQHDRRFSLRISYMPLPDLLMKKMKPINEPAEEVDLLVLLTCEAGLDYVGFCEREVGRLRKDVNAAADLDTMHATGEACWQLHRAVVAVKAARPPIAQGTPSLAGVQWPTFPEWCRLDTPPGSDTLRPLTLTQGAADALVQARDALKREVMAALLATKSHRPRLGRWASGVPGRSRQS